MAHVKFRNALPKKAPKKKIDANEARAWCFSVDILISVDKEGDLIINDPHECMTEWLKDALRTHKAEIVTLIQIKTKYEWLIARMKDLRYVQSLSKMDREQSLDFLGDRIEMFSDECHEKFQSYNGYEDFADPFSDIAVCDLRREFAELTYRPQGYPIPVNNSIPRNCRGWRIDNEWYPRIAMKPDKVRARTTELRRAAV
jgi:hypothetical protein